MKYSEYKKTHECIPRYKFMNKKKEIVTKVYQYYSEYNIEARTKKDIESLVCKNIAVLGDTNSGKTAIFTKAIGSTEAKYSKNGKKSRFEDMIKVQRGTDSNIRFGMEVSEI